VSVTPGTGWALTDVASDRVLVAGIGNIFCGDDGFGPAVAARLAALPLPERVRVWDVGVRGLHLAYELLDSRYERVILIDAVSRGEVPGTVYVIEPEAGTIEPAALADAHSMGPDAVLGLLKRLGGAPPSLVIVGCEPARFAEDMTLSEPVAATIGEAVDVVLRLISR
jgi:hydrogenase maturation protease